MIDVARAGKEQKTSEICVLPDGRRVRFSLQKRDRDPVYRACFAGPDGRRLERSTREKSRKRATDAAGQLIQAAFMQRQSVYRPPWNEAVGKMVRHMEAANLRPATVERYVHAVECFRRWAHVDSPADVTPQMAEQYKIARGDAGRSQATVATDLRSLSVVYSKWWMKSVRLLATNPFETIEPPKQEKRTPRVIADDEKGAFLDWLAIRYDNWRLPVLFLEVKSRIGCRIGELASAKSGDLQDGRLCFAAETTKGRKQRRCRLPESMYAELQSVAGKEFLFERFADELRFIHARQNRPRAATSVREFTPKRLIAWLQDQADLYFEQTGRPRFKLHNFRGTAMSRARQHGVTYDDASIAFGCHPETMRRHYVVEREDMIADAVMEKI